MGRAPDSNAGGMLAHLLGRPWWLLGLGLAFLAFVLHALALQRGSLALVQPIVVTSVVLAVPVRAWVARRTPSRAEAGTVAATGAGVALFLVAARPTPGHLAESSWPAVALTAVGASVAAVAVLRARRCVTSRRTGTLLGFAAGVLFGLVAGLLKVTGATLTRVDPLSVLTCWSVWTVVAVGVAGVATTQYGYRVTGISASLCALNMTDVVVALVFGDVAFGEVPAHDPLALALEALAVALVTVGLHGLGRVTASHEQPTASVG